MAREVLHRNFEIHASAYLSVCLLDGFFTIIAEFSLQPQVMPRRGRSSAIAAKVKRKSDNRGIWLA